jgi:hypothetical protein
MDESIVKTLTETIPASEWIRRGIPLVTEERLLYLADWKGLCGCALGTGYHAKTGKYFAGDLRAISKSLRLPYEIAYRANTMHIEGASREAVADWLESKGF